MLNQENTSLVIIDIQEKLLNAIFNKETVEKKSKILYTAAQLLELPVFVTEQYPQGLGETVNGLKEKASVYIKTSFNALEDENFVNELKNSGKTQIILIGIETHICVYQTALALLKEHFDVTVVNDACGSRSEFEYKEGLRNIIENGASVKSTEMVLFELLKSAKHPKFKEIQALIK